MSDTDDQLALIDDTIAADHALYLKATWAGHDGEADWYRVEVDRLRNLRSIVERGLLPAPPRAWRPERD